jgi:pilus assembly protein CpaC
MHPTHRVLNLLTSALVGLGLMAPLSALAQAPGAADTAIRNRAGTFVIPVQTTKVMGMTTKRPIRSVVNEKETVLRIDPIPNDNTAVRMTGLMGGSSKVTMTDDQGAVESIDIVVELVDIEQFRSVLHRAFPTAQVEPISIRNSIVLTGTVAHAEEIEAILRVAQDLLLVAQGQSGGPGGTLTVVNAMTVGGVRQVQLDVVIAQVNRSKLRNFGVNFAVAGSTVPFASTIGGIVTPGGTTGGSTGGTTGGTVGIGGGNIASTFINSLTPSTTANIIAGIVPWRTTIFIQALKNENLAKLLAEPRLVTLSGRPATFLSGGQQAVPQVTGGGTSGGVVGTQFEPFGTTLTFLPIVYGNGKIYLEVEPAVSALNAGNGFSIGGTIVAGRTEQRVRTSVVMEPGQTFAIGGLIQNEVNASTNKVPILGELPFIGPAFSTISYDESETELVILVTPYLVDPDDCRQAPCKLPGFETRTPDDFELFLELILEAPRGQRDVFQDKKYKAAWTNDPSANKFPCGGGSCANGTCGNPAGGCATCGQSAVMPATAGGTHESGSQAAAPATPVVPAGTTQKGPADPPDIVPAVALPNRGAERP